MIRRSNIPSKEIIKGRVTNVNQTLLYFEIDNKIRIYIDFKKDEIEFPCIEEHIELNNLDEFLGPPIDPPYIGAIGSGTTCKFGKTTAFTPHDNEAFGALKKMFTDDSNEIIEMDKVIRILQDLVTSSDSIFKCLVQLLTLPIEGNPLDKVKKFSKMQIKLPSHLNYVNRNSDLYSFIRYDGLCHFGVYHDSTVEVLDTGVQYLFGILEVDPNYGCFSLKDRGKDPFKSKLLVRFFSCSADLYKFKNTLVMITEWIVITEIFDLKNVVPLKYILLYPEDIIVIEKLSFRVARTFFRKDEVVHTEKNFTFLQTVRISEVIIGYTGLPECWIECLTSNLGPTKSQRTPMFICLSNIDVVPFLKEHTVYKMFFTESPTKLNLGSHRELFALRKNYSIYRVAKSTIFQETDEIPYTEKEMVLESFHNLKDFLSKASAYQLFSFTLKISRKQLQQMKWQSWYPRRHDNYPYYGQPGGDKYQERLIYYDESSKQYLDLYLTNMENHVTPLGLVNDMVVKVKNVQANKNKYLKASVFTSFEIIDYTPTLTYSSVNLSFSDTVSWKWRNETQPVPLGLFSFLPVNCIVHGSFLFHAIYDLSIIPVCAKCQSRVLAGRPCSNCDVTERDLFVRMTIRVQDSQSPLFNIDTENKDFLFDILGLKKPIEVQYFCNSFFKCNNITFDFVNFKEFLAESCTEDGDSRQFLINMGKLIHEKINYRLYAMIDAVCISKMERNPWLMVEFEAISNT